MTRDAYIPPKKLAKLLRTILLASAACSLAAVASPAFADSGGSSTTSSPANTNVAVFGTQTASATAPDGRGIFSFGATPGGQLKDHVAVRNYSLQALTLTMTGSDAVNTPEGDFALSPPNEHPKEVGTWISLPFGDSTVTVPPRSDVIIPFSVSVPENASPGDHVGGITATLESLITSKSGQRIHLLQSVGTRIFIKVSGPLRPVLAVGHVSIRYDDSWNPLVAGRASISYTVTNVGNVALGGEPSITVSGLFGSKRTASHLPQVQLLLPGFSVRETANVTGIYPEFIESAHISVVRLIVPGSIQPLSGPFTASASFWAVPWTLLAIAAVIVIVAIWWFVRRRRRKASRGAKQVGTGPVGPEGSQGSGLRTRVVGDEEGTLSIDASAAMGSSGEPLSPLGSPRASVGSQESDE